MICCLINMKANDTLNKTDVWKYVNNSWVITILGATIGGLILWFIIRWIKQFKKSRALPAISLEHLETILDGYKKFEANSILENGKEIPFITQKAILVFHSEDDRNFDIESCKILLVYSKYYSPINCGRSEILRTRTKRIPINISILARKSYIAKMGVYEKKHIKKIVFKILLKEKNKKNIFFYGTYVYDIENGKPITPSDFHFIKSNGKGEYIKAFNPYKEGLKYKKHPNFADGILIED